MIEIYEVEEGILVEILDSLVEVGYFEGDPNTEEDAILMDKVQDLAIKVGVLEEMYRRNFHLDYLGEIND